MSFGVGSLGDRLQLGIYSQPIGCWLLGLVGIVVKFLVRFCDPPFCNHVFQEGAR